MRAGLEIVAFVAAGCLLTGCDAGSPSPLGSSGLQVQGNGGAARPAGADDPFGVCLVDQHTHGWFDCSQGDTTCTGWGSGSCANGTCTSVYHAACDHTCQVAADCPVPATGDVKPTCHPEVHGCFLPCDDSSTCPDGLTCQSTADWGLYTAAGKVPPPFLCMQTLIVTGSDAGIP